MGTWENFSGNAPGYFISFSADNVIVNINDFLLDDLGFLREEVVGKMRFEELLTVGGKIFFQTHFYPLVKVKKEAREIYLSFRCKDRSDIPVLLNVLLQDFDDRYEIHCVGLKISNRNLYEQELLDAKKTAEQALEENQELVAVKKELKSANKKLEKQLRKLSQHSSEQIELNKVLSHDLQEPLRKIGIFSSMLPGQQDNLNEKVLQTIGKLGESVSKVRWLLDGLEKFNSLNHKKIEMVGVDLAAMLHRVQDRLNNFSEDVQIEFQDNSNTPGGLYITTDSNLCFTFFTELLGYALRFKNSTYTELRFCITADTFRMNSFVQTKNKYLYEDFARITISDDGKGLLQSAFPFELFNRSQLLDDKMDIGLAFCKKIIQLLNGTITLTSDELSGTRFVVLVPMRSE